MSAVLAVPLPALASDPRISRGRLDGVVHEPSSTSWRQPLELAALFDAEARSLVRLARFFVDDRDAAEDLVQEAFLRLQRSAHGPDDLTKAPAYLRSVVLNLARDHNRRGLMSLRHQLPRGREVDVEVDPVERDVLRNEGQRAVLDAVRALPKRQRDCVVLRYYESFGIDQIAQTLRLSPNSVKTHLRRGLDSLEHKLEQSR